MYIIGNGRRSAERGEGGMHFRRWRSECGETLVETMASVIILGIFVASLYQISTSVITSEFNQVLNEQALAYAKLYINQIRMAQLISGSLPVPSNKPEPLPPADGAAFTAEWTQPTTPSWLSSSGLPTPLNQYLVTVTWTKPNGLNHSVNLQFIIYPNAD